MNVSESTKPDLDLNFSSEDELEKKLMDPDIRLTHNDFLILMSFRLPIIAVRDSDGVLSIKESRSLLYPPIYRLKDKGMINFKWVGWPGIFPRDEHEKLRVQELLAQYQCYPVWIPQDIMDKFLLFHEQFMRPLFHNFKSTSDTAIDQHNSELWHAYCEVNSLFVSSLIQVKRERELVWIHDVYLLLTPFYLKKKDLNANIGFFMHSPFPCSDIMKTFQYRTEIMKSLLCSDLIGFHRFEYARNFSASCRKLLLLNIVTKKGGFIGVEYNGRTILLKASHIGIEQD